MNEKASDMRSSNFFPDGVEVIGTCSEPIFESPQNPVEILTLNVMVLGDGAFGK